MDRSAYLHIIEQHLKTAYLLTEEKAAAMIPVFVANLIGHMDQLAAVEASGDLEQLARSSHRVKGALLNLGLADLAATAFSIEQESKRQNGAAEIPALVTRLTAAVNVLAGRQPPDLR